MTGPVSPLGSAGAFSAGLQRDTGHLPDSAVSTDTGCATPSLEENRSPWYNDDASWSADFQSARLRASISASRSNGSINTPTSRTPPTRQPRNLVRKTKPFVRNELKTKISYTVFKYLLQPFHKPAVNAATPGGADGNTLGALATNPTQFMKAEYLGNGSGGFWTDFSITSTLEALTGYVLYRSYKEHKAARHNEKKFDQRQTMLDSAQTKWRNIGEGIPALYKDAAAASLEHQRDTLAFDRDINKHELRETACLMVGGSVLGAKTAANLGTKIAALASSSAGSGASMIASGIGTLGLAPIASVALLGESLLQARRATRLERIHQSGEKEVAAYLHTLGKTAPPEIDQQAFNDYRAFIERKLSMRSKFFRRFKIGARFRAAAAAFLAATTFTKIGITAASLQALYNSRKSRRYSSYKRDDDCTLDRRFNEALEAYEALSAPPDALKAASLSTTTGPDTRPIATTETDSEPGESHPLLSAPLTPRSHSPEPIRRSSRQAPRLHSNQRAPSLASILEERRPLMGGIIDSGAQDENNEDEDGLPSPPTLSPNLHGYSHGIGLRVQQHVMLERQGHAHAKLKQDLLSGCTRHSKNPLVRWTRNLGNRLTAWRAWGTRFALSLDRSDARRAYRQARLKGAADLTPGHYRHAIQTHSPAWKDFILSHLDAEANLLHLKNTIREKLGLRQGEDDDPLGRFAQRDGERLVKISGLESEMRALGATRENLSTQTTRAAINRSFLALIKHRGEVNQLGNEQVCDALARAMHKHFEGRIRNLKGMLYESEHDASLIRLRAVRSDVR